MRTVASRKLAHETRIRKTPLRCPRISPEKNTRMAASTVVLPSRHPPTRGQQKQARAPPRLTRAPALARAAIRRQNPVLGARMSDSRSAGSVVANCKLEFELAHDVKRPPGFATLSFLVARV